MSAPGLPPDNCLVVAMDVACEGLHSELSPSSSDSELIRTGHGCDGERTPDHTPVDLDGYGISVGVRVKAITGPGQAVGKHFGSYVFYPRTVSLATPPQVDLRLVAIACCLLLLFLHHTARSPPQ